MSFVHERNYNIFNVGKLSPNGIKPFAKSVLSKACIKAANLKIYKPD
jgi:hypothetical protein